MLKLLLNRGAIIDAKSCILLHAAAASIKDQEVEGEVNDGWEVMEYLIRNYPLDPYERNEKGLTPKDILVQIDWSFEDYYAKLVDECRTKKDTALSGDSLPSF